MSANGLVPNASVPSRPLYVCDLDGTLLGGDEKLSVRTISVVNRLVADGVLFTYATARSFTSASQVTAPLRLQIPVVTYGGAVIVDPRSGQARPATMMPARAVAALQGAGARHGASPILFAMHEGRDRLAWLPSLTTVHAEAFLSRRREDPRLLPLQTWASINTDSVFYASLIAEQHTLRRLRDEVTDELDGCHVVLSEDVYTPGQFWFEVSSSAATKADAITALRSELAADHLVCFGDNLNDLPMFAVADHAVAVSNAATEVQQAADEIIGSNDEDAVAEWLSAHA